MMSLPYYSNDLMDFCTLPAKPLTILSEYLKERGINKDFDEIITDLAEDYKSAYDSSMLDITDMKITFKSRYLKDNGKQVEMVLKPSAYGSKTWFLYYVNTVAYEDAVLAVNPGKQLENFAFLGNWTSFLTELADKAIPEEWDFQGGEDGQYRILIQYIKYTFCRLSAERKICISKDEQFAAFNTGLVDKHYDDIFVCFTPNPIESSTKWKFAGFCTAASGTLGKTLVRYFKKLPEPPMYFSNNSDLLFNYLKPLYLDFEHIIIDNLNRLPLQFLYDQVYSSEDAKAIIEQLRSVSIDYEAKKELYSKLREILSTDHQLFKRISNRIQDAVDLAKKRVRWNYRTAIPLYYPKNNSMSLMLPLALIDDTKADVALVVELMPSGSYQGQTVLTLSQAYIDARLVCRLTGDWLDPSKIFEHQPESED